MTMTGLLSRNTSHAGLGHPGSARRGHRPTQYHAGRSAHLHASPEVWSEERAEQIHVPFAGTESKSRSFGESIGELIQENGALLGVCGVVLALFGMLAGLGNAIL